MKKLLVFFLALFVISLGTLVYLHKTRTQDSYSNFPEGGSFLFEQGTKQVRLEDFAGKIVILYFGFTYCPDICPTSLSTFKAVYKKLSREKKKDVQMLFITVDPERDTQKKLDDYVSFFDPSIIALRGSVEYTRELAKKYRVNFKKYFPNKDSKSYTIDHTTTFFLLGKDGEILEIFHHDISGDELLNKLNTYL